MKIADFKGLARKSTAEVTEVLNAGQDYYTVKMKTESGVAWRPGEHGAFWFAEKKIKGKSFRAFSVASIPEEGFLMIGTRTGENISDFKRNLINSDIGEKIRVLGPFGWFTLRENDAPVVLIAAGVGITPIRALLKELEIKKDRKAEVIHVSSDYFLFEDELREIARKDDKITLHYIKSKQEAEDLIKKIAMKYKNSAYYYISGSLKMILQTKKLIRKLKIKRNRIINDPFFGY